jgi:hypothetical protein
MVVGQYGRHDVREAGSAKLEVAMIDIVFPSAPTRWNGGLLAF